MLDIVRNTNILTLSRRTLLSPFCSPPPISILCQLQLLTDLLQFQNYSYQKLTGFTVPIFHQLIHIQQTLKYKLLGMSRCQHGQVISLFCINQNCTWREAGGCQQCLKKYHSHAITNDIISQQKIEQLFNRTLVKPDLKTKCRPLQQAIYNYFMIMKSQISSSMDAVSREISQRLGYPFLQSQNQLGTFKKIKNREYKKLTKLQLISFYKFASEIDPTYLEEQENSLYNMAVDRIDKVVSEINEVFTQYSKVVAKLDSTFNIESTFYEKIRSISSVIIKAKTEGSEKTKESIVGKGDEKLLGANIHLQNRQKDRKVSLEVGAQQIQQMSKFWTGNYRENEKEIEERKRKLLEMLNPSQKEQKFEKIQKIEVDFQQPSIKDDLNSTTNQNKSSRKSGFYSAEKSIKENQKSGQEIFNDFLSKGINIPEMIAHTVLPRQASRQKLYEDKKDVQQRKINVPMKKIDDEEISSPLLKKRRQKNQLQQAIKLEAVPSASEKEEAETPKQKLAQMKIQATPEKQQQIYLKDKQAESVALLIQSLPLAGQKAVPLLQTAIKLSPNNLSVAEYLSYLYLELGKPKQCLDLSNKFLEQLENSPNPQQLSQHLNNNKAAALNMLGRYSESITILQKCLRYSEKDIYYKNLGDAYFSIGINEKAILNYEKALILNRNMDETLYNLAVCHFIQDHMYEAKLHILRALKLSPKNQQYNELHRQIVVKIQI